MNAKLHTRIHIATIIILRIKHGRATTYHSPVTERQKTCLQSWNKAGNQEDGAQVQAPEDSCNLCLQIALHTLFYTVQSAGIVHGDLDISNFIFDEKIYVRNTV